MPLNTLQDYKASTAKRYLIGLVGQGPALGALTRILERDDFIAAFPRVKVVGWVPHPDALSDADELDVPSVLQKQPVYADVETLCHQRPGIQLILDLSEKSQHMEHIRSCAPVGVSLAASDSILGFCAAAEEGKLAIGGGESLRKAENLFAVLMDQIEDDILILSKDGTILDINQHAYVSRDLQRKDCLGINCGALDPSMPCCYETDAICPYEQARETGKKVERTFTRLMPNGRVRYLHTSCFPLLDPFGAPSQFLFVRRDITEQQNLEQRLQQTEKMAAIGELSTYMAHEIRNPLFAIGGFANALLRNPSLDDNGKEKARIILQESRRLDTILSNILNFTRPTEQEMTDFSPDAVARETLDFMSLGSTERAMKVVVDIQEYLPHVRGNPENLRQCLINIIKNAIESMPEGGTLTLRGKRNGRYVQLDVEDTGRGIAPDLQEQVFSPFYTTKQSGSGLGLAMTRKIISEMGGQVSLASKPGLGTRVTMLIPMALALQDNVSEEG